MRVAIDKEVQVNMSSNSRMTRSMGPAEDVSLPLPARIRKDALTTVGERGNAQTQVDGRVSQQGTAGNPSPFARPGSRAGSSIGAASEVGTPSTPSNPFARPDSRAGSTQRSPPSSSISLLSPSNSVSRGDADTSVCWDLVNPDFDSEVANITNNSPHSHIIATNQPCPNVKEGPSNTNPSGPNNQDCALYNHDFFIADTTGRRLSQVQDKSRYPQLLPNGNAALQLRLPDLLIYLKTDTFLIDVTTGHHYAMYNNRIEKMSVLPKLYSAWPYRQLMKNLQDDATRFGVSSPEPNTSEAQGPQEQQPVSNPQHTQKEQPSSPCQPTVVRYEPPTFGLKMPSEMLTRAERVRVLQNHVAAVNALFSKLAVLEDLINKEPHNSSHYKEVQRVQCNQHMHVAVKLQQMLEADDQLRDVAGLPQLDLPEHLWTVRNMTIAQAREEHFMTITSEIEILCQQTKGKGMYPNLKQNIANNNVHFQPIQPAQMSPLQPEDRLLFDPLHQPSSTSSGSQTTTGSGFVHTPSPQLPQQAVPPTPYVNQTAVDQHAKTTQSLQTQPRKDATSEHNTPTRGTEDLISLASQPQTSPQGKRSKSKNGLGVKQSKNINIAANKICWQCGEKGHLKKDCPHPPVCGQCRKEGHVPRLCPLNNTRRNEQQSHQQNNRFSNPTNKCLHCRGEHPSAACPTKYQQIITPSTSTRASAAPTLLVNNAGSSQRTSASNSKQRTPQVSPNVQHFSHSSIPPVQPLNQFPPPPYFPIPFPPPPVPPSNVSVAPSAPSSDLSAALTLMTNAVAQGNNNTTAITDALQKTTSQFATALQQTIKMGVDAQAEENKNARLDKQFDKIKIFDGSNPADCHPWLEEVHALCTQTGRPFREMLLLCAGRAVRDFIVDMAPDATEEQIKNDIITGYSDLQGLGCKQAAYDNIAQRPEEPVRSYIVRYSRLFKLLNGTAPNEVRMRTTSMHFVNSLRSYLSSKVENRLLGMNHKNYSLGDTFNVALECELKAIATERHHNKRTTMTVHNIEIEDTNINLQEIDEAHVRNPNYKGKNYDPNFQSRKIQNNKQQDLAGYNGSQYKTPYTKPATNNNLSSSSDIAGEVTLKTTVDGYQLLKVNELIKNAAAWRARMPKTSKYDKYFDNKDKPASAPKVQINEATLEVMGQTAKDCGYTKKEFVEAIEMYQHFGDISLEDVPVPSQED